MYFVQGHNKFLGHTVSTEGISTRPDKIKAIQEWKVLTNVQDVRSFIDLCSYSRIFVREFATIAKLLHDLTARRIVQVKRGCQKDEVCLNTLVAR